MQHLVVDQKAWLWRIGLQMLFSSGDLRLCWHYESNNEFYIYCLFFGSGTQEWAMEHLFQDLLWDLIIGVCFAARVGCQRTFVLWMFGVRSILVCFSEWVTNNWSWVAKYAYLEALFPYCSSKLGFKLFWFSFKRSVGWTASHLSHAFHLSGNLNGGKVQYWDSTNAEKYWGDGHFWLPFNVLAHGCWLQFVQQLILSGSSRFWQDQRLILSGSINFWISCIFINYLLRQFLVIEDDFHSDFVYTEGARTIHRRIRPFSPRVRTDYWMPIYTNPPITYFILRYSPFRFYIHLTVEEIYNGSVHTF